MTHCCTGLQSSSPESAGAGTTGTSETGVGCLCSSSSTQPTFSNLVIN